MEPLNNGHVWDKCFAHCSEVVPSSEVEMHRQYIGRGQTVSIIGGFTLISCLHEKGLALPNIKVVILYQIILVCVQLRTLLYWACSRSARSQNLQPICCKHACRVSDRATAIPGCHTDQLQQRERERQMQEVSTHTRSHT